MMINGIFQIVAAVLFAMVYLFGQMGPVWLWIAAGYLVVGIINLIIHALHNRRRRKAQEPAQDAV